MAYIINVYIKQNFTIHFPLEMTLMSKWKYKLIQIFVCLCFMMFVMWNLHAEVRMIFFTEMSYSLTHTEFCCEKCLRLIKVFYKFSLLFYFILFSW